MVILYEKKDKIASITLNRPEAFNSVNPEMLQELSRVLSDFRDDDNLWVAIITGLGTGHSALVPISKQCCHFCRRTGANPGCPHLL